MLGMNSRARNIAVGIIVAFLAASTATGHPDPAMSAADVRAAEATPRVFGAERTVSLPDGRRLRLSRNGETLTISVSGTEDPERPLPLLKPRRNASLSLLPSGRVLIWGGSDAQGRLIEGGQWFDPESSTLSAAGLPVSPRAGHTATVLTDGNILFAGGISSHGSAELWNERSNRIVVLAMDADKFGHVARLQGDGYVLLQGGVSSSGKKIRRDIAYDEERRRFTPVVDRLPPSRIAPEPRLAASLPKQDARGVSPDAWPALRFTHPVRLSDLSVGKVSLLGPGGNVAIRTAPAENGRLVFVKPLQALFPDTRYTLMIDGARGMDGAALPLIALDFKTMALGSGQGPGIESGSIGGKTAQSETLTGLDPLAKPCRHGGAYSPCRGQGKLVDGVWSPGRDNTHNRWRIPGPQLTAERDANLARIAKTFHVTAVRGRVLRVDQMPVAGVEVSAGNAHAFTDANGWFTLFDVPAGYQELYVDGSVANRGELQYGQFVVGVDVKRGQLNELPYLMHLPRITRRDKIRIASPLQQDLVVGHPDIPGLQLHIPKGTVIHDRKGRLVTELAIVPTPVNRAPFPVMENHPMAFTVEPGAAQIRGLDPKAANGIRVYYPNYDGYAAGTRADFWIYDPREGWRVYGKGAVSEDQRFVVPERGVALHQTMGGMYSVPSDKPATEPNQPADQTGDCNCSGTPGDGGPASGGDPVDLKTGEFIYSETDIAIADIVPLTLARSYRPHDMTSREFGVGTAGNWNYYLHNPGGTYANLDLVLPNGAFVRFARLSGTGASGEWRQAGSTTGFSGAVLRSVYDSDPAQRWGRAYRITMRDGSQMQFSSYNDTRMRWMEDKYGNRTTLVYDSGLVSTIVSPGGRSLTLEYDGNNRIDTVRDHTGREWFYQYGSKGLLSQVTFPDTTTRLYTYQTRLDGSGNLVQHRVESVTDQRGKRVVLNEFEVVSGVSTGRVIKQTQADGGFYTYNYAHVDGATTGVLVTNPDGSRRRVVFDTATPYPKTDTVAYGTPLAQTYTFERNAYGQINARIDPLGRRMEYEYNAQGEVTKVTQMADTAQARSVDLTYTPEGDLLTITDPLERTTTLGYTQRCLTSVTSPLGKTTSIVCNSAGQPLSVTDPLGKTTTLQYEGYELVRVDDPMGRWAKSRYDALGRRLASEDMEGNIVRYEYDLLDRITKIIDPASRATEIGFDANGNVEAVLLPNGNGITYTYDDRNRLLTRTDSLNQAESWTYDLMDRVETATNRKYQTTGFDYDTLGRLTVTTFQDSNTQTASYDAANRMIALVDTSAGTLGWDYNDFDELVEATSAQGTVLYDYDAAGRRTEMIAASQAAVTYTYDDGDRLQQIMQGSEVVAFDYDDADRLIETVLPNDVKAGYAYNDAGQLTGTAWLKPDTTPLGDLGYGYDAQGRLVAQTGSFASDNLPAASTGANVFDDNNRQTQYNGATLTYDDNGNLTGDGAYTYVWNTRNQLIQVKQGANEIANYIYDPLGRRISRNFIGYTTTYLYDGVDPVQETMGGVVNPILTGQGIDQRFARNDVGGRTYFLTDHLGSTRALTNTAGNVVNRYDYSPYGETSESSALGYLNPYRYTGREADVAGLYYYRARYYHPGMGRFISEDPIGFSGGDANFYAYVGNNPLSYTDVLGLARQYGLGLGGTIGILPIGAGAGLGVGISVPDNWKNWKCYQIYANGQLNVMGGAGAFAGWGVSGSVSSSTESLATYYGGMYRYAELGGGWGISGGYSEQGSQNLLKSRGTFGWLRELFSADGWNNDKASSRAFSPPMKFGVGYGAWAGLGYTIGGGFATPTFSQCGCK